MNRKVIFAAVMLAGVSSAPASAQVVIQMSEITCKQYLESDADRKLLLGSWMSGYYSASKNLNVLDFRYVKRNKAKAEAYCKKHKSNSLMNAVMKTAH